MAWVLVAWAHQFRRELNALAPDRDTASDGSVGDLAHQEYPSGHNPDESGNAERQDSDSIDEVRAIDVDVDLRVPGLTAQMIVAYLVGRCRAGLERRLIYIIFNGVIWSASGGWVARTYTGSNPHDKHFHLSGHPAGDADPSPFGLATLLKEDTMTPAEYLKILQDPSVAAFFRAAPWTYAGGGLPSGMSALSVLNGTYLAAKEAAGEEMDPAEVASLVLGGLDLTPEKIAAAIPAAQAKAVADELATILAARMAA